MSEAVFTIPGKVIRDLCETLGVDPANVNLIEITPKSVVVVRELRRSDAVIQFNGNHSDALTRVTEIGVRWADDA